MIKIHTTVSIIICSIFTSSPSYGGYSVTRELQVNANGLSVPENNWHNVAPSAILSFNIQDTSSTQTKETIPKRAKEENWEAGTSVIIGIAGWMSTLLSGVFGIYFLISIPAIILGIKGLKRYKKRKYLAILGLILGFTLGLFLLFATFNILPRIV
jgi:hypothetical protein